jgi:hypothetical protein
MYSIGFPFRVFLVFVSLDEEDLSDFEFKVKFEKWTGTAEEATKEENKKNVI